MFDKLWKNININIVNKFWLGNLLRSPLFFKETSRIAACLEIQKNNYLEILDVNSLKTCLTRLSKLMGSHVAIN